MKRRRRNKRVYKSGVSNKFLIISVFVIVSLVLGSKILTQNQKSQANNVLGSLFAKGGDDSSDSGSSGSDNSGSGSEDSGSSDSDDDDSSGSSAAPTPTPTRSFIQRVIQRFRPITPTPRIENDEDENEDENEQKIRTEQEIKKDERRTEIRLSETERIRVRTKDGRTRIDITQGGIKTRLEIRDDRVVIKAEQEDGIEVELEEDDDTLLKIEERLAASQIKIATDEANRFVIQRGTTGAVSQFPVSIDLATNALIINTPSGVKNVTVLPDQAVRNLLVANVVNRLGGNAVVNAVRTGEVSTLAQVVTLGEKNGIPIYEINGISDQKLLGFIPITIEKTIDISAQTGVVISTQVSFVNQLLDLISL